MTPENKKSEMNDTNPDWNVRGFPGVGVVFSDAYVTSDAIKKYTSRMRGFLLAVLCLVLLTSCWDSDDQTWQSGLREVMAATERDYPQVQQVTTKQVNQWMADPSEPLLLDVREPKEFAVSHLHGAVNVSPSASASMLEQSILSRVDKGHRIVTYCSVGVRSAILAERLQEAGFTRVYNLNGSIFLWANEGRPVYRGDSVVSRVHPYDTHWGQLLRPRLRAPMAGR